MFFKNERGQKALTLLLKITVISIASAPFLMFLVTQVDKFNNVLIAPLIITVFFFIAYILLRALYDVWGGMIVFRKTSKELLMNFLVIEGGIAIGIMISDVLQNSRLSLYEIAQQFGMSITIALSVMAVAILLLVYGIRVRYGIYPVGGDPREKLDISVRYKRLSHDDPDVLISFVLKNKGYEYLLRQNRTELYTFVLRRLLGHVSAPLSSFAELLETKTGRDIVQSALKETTGSTLVIFVANTGDAAEKDYVLAYLKANRPEIKYREIPNRVLQVAYLAGFQNMPMVKAIQELVQGENLLLEIIILLHEELQTSKLIHFFNGFSENEISRKRLGVRLTGADKNRKMTYDGIALDNLIKACKQLGTPTNKYLTRVIEAPIRGVIDYLSECSKKYHPGKQLAEKLEALEDVLSNFPAQAKA